MVVLNVSIVIYKTNEDKIQRLVALLRQSQNVNEIFVIDNSPSPFLTPHNMDATYIFNNKNYGYGRAHNIALRKTIASKVPYHLVLNPDVVFEPSVINGLLRYMDDNTSIGSLMPKIYYPNGDLQHLCKLVPTPLDLFGRRFLPKWMMRKRKRRFELCVSCCCEQVHWKMSGCLTNVFSCIRKILTLQGVFTVSTKQSFIRT